MEKWVIALAEDDIYKALVFFNRMYDKINEVQGDSAVYEGVASIILAQIYSQNICFTSAKGGIYQCTLN